MTDRLDALSTQHPDPTAAHYVLAQVYNQGFIVNPTHPYPTLRVPAAQRAQVLAQIDMLRAELPDVFVVQAPGTGGGQGVYPLNFGAVAFGSSGTSADYLLPLGANGQYAAAALSTNPAVIGQNTEIGINAQNAVPTSMGGRLAPTGIYGASFAAAAGIYKQLGYGPQGTDGADNNDDGNIDDLREGLIGLPAGSQAEIVRRLAAHKHETARAEMLYAVLVEGSGPLGSVFSADDFNQQEVKDTDGDGLLEFVDAWGKPLQFFRWPIFYHSDVQRGFPELAKIIQDQGGGLVPGPYTSVYETREVNPLDPNQQLVSPEWWTSFNDGPGIDASDGSYKISGAALTFMRYFHTLTEPLAMSPSASPSNMTYWDRSTAASLAGAAQFGRAYMAGAFRRRAYYCRPLIVSGGSDKVPGVAQLGVDYKALDTRSYFPLPNGGTTSDRDNSGSLVAVNVANVLQVENQGAKVDPNRGPAPYFAPVFGTGADAWRNDTNTFLEEASHDDITNHNLNSTGGPTSQ